MSIGKPLKISELYFLLLLLSQQTSGHERNKMRGKKKYKTDTPLIIFFNWRSGWHRRWVHGTLMIMDFNGQRALKPRKRSLTQAITTVTNPEEETQKTLWVFPTQRKTKRAL